ncbi:hypothetical protein H1D32_07895 [Anaerobacillus sp. CMMVII]|nr:hypothetical protein [Anaerobacillus sp. CMMVII]
MCIFIAIFTIIASKHFYDHRVKTTALAAKEVLTEHAQIEELENERARQRLLTKNMDTNLANIVYQAIENNDKVNIVIVSSEFQIATRWYDIFESELHTHYRDDLFNLTVVEYNDKSSYQFVHEQHYNIILEKEPDVLIIDAFLLNDNGIYLIEDTLTNLDSIINEIKNNSDDLVVIVQPPHPMYDEGYYLAQVEKLEAHVSEKGYLYFDHWSNWPEFGYLTDNQPNLDGHKHWSEFITNYFIANKKGN